MIGRQEKEDIVRSGGRIAAFGVGGSVSTAA